MYREYFALTRHPIRNEVDIDEAHRRRDVIEDLRLLTEKRYREAGGAVDDPNK